MVRLSSSRRRARFNVVLLLHIALSTKLKEMLQLLPTMGKILVIRFGSTHARLLLLSIGPSLAPTVVDRLPLDTIRTTCLEHTNVVRASPLLCPRKIFDPKVIHEIKKYLPHQKRALRHLFVGILAVQALQRDGPCHVRTEQCVIFMSASRQNKRFSEMDLARKSFGMPLLEDRVAMLIS